MPAKAEEESQRDREAERQRGREAERQRGREAERQRDKERRLQDTALLLAHWRISAATAIEIRTARASCPIATSPFPNPPMPP